LLFYKVSPSTFLCVLFHRSKFLQASSAFSFSLESFLLHFSRVGFDDILQSLVSGVRNTPLPLCTGDRRTGFTFYLLLFIRLAVAPQFTRMLPDYVRSMFTPAIRPPQVICLLGVADSLSPRGPSNRIHWICLIRRSMTVRLQGFCFDLSSHVSSDPLFPPPTTRAFAIPSALLLFFCDYILLASTPAASPPFFTNAKRFSFSPFLLRLPPPVPMMNDSSLSPCER